MATIILIHGSWHGAWCWHKVTPLLEAQGHRVLVPDLPAHGRSWRTIRGLETLGSMVRVVTRILDSLPEPAIIVAHSRGGIIASRAAELRPRKVASLVYLASFMLRNGERVADYFFNDRDSLLQGHVTIDRLRATDMIEQQIYREALYADCSASDLALAQALLTPEPSLPALTRLKLSDENYGSVDRYYIELLRDCAVSPALQRTLIAQSPCKRVYSIDASHSAYFSKPDELAAIVDEVAWESGKSLPLARSVSRPVGHDHGADRVEGCVEPRTVLGLDQVSRGVDDGALPAGPARGDHAATVVR
jgi:pimeloyl-ACP methyl ester carboxylesterase